MNYSGGGARRLKETALAVPLDQGIEVEPDVRQDRLRDRPDLLIDVMLVVERRAAPRRGLRPRRRHHVLDEPGGAARQLPRRLDVRRRGRGVLVEPLPQRLAV